MNSKRAESTIIFLHVSKAAGTTMHGILNQQYSKNQTLRFNGIESRNELLNLPISQLSQLKLIRGHFAFGIHQFLDFPCTYFTILRNPVARFISHYHYIHRSPDVPRHREISKMTLMDFVTYEGSSFGNLQTRMLFGLSDSPGDSHHEILDTVKQNIQSYFPVIGLTEYFDETLVLLRHQFGWGLPVYINQNITNYPHRKDSKIDSKILDLIEESNQLDIELYNWVSLRFHEQLQSLGTTLSKDLKKQRLLNTLYQPFGRTYGFARSLILQNLRRNNG